MIKKQTILKYILITFTMLLFTACGGSDDSSSPKNNPDIPQLDSSLNEESNNTSVELKEAYLIDSAIQGVEYKTNTQNGTTNNNGTFKYSIEDTIVTFKIGNLILADFNLSNLKEDNKILPSDIFGQDRNDTSNENVLKFLRLIQSLDNDNNPNNGILIDDNTKNLLITNINLKDANITMLEIIIISAQKTLKSKFISINHFESTLNDMNISYQKIIGHNEIMYDTVTSPFTNKIWLDRNLGASRVCLSFDDSSCYGNYYQWGRDDDGHEMVTSNSTFRLSTQINDVNLSGEFIKINENNTSRFDWLESGIDDNGSLRSSNWSKIDGSSICPVGFRVPTKDELNNETINLSGENNVTNRVDAFNNFLKLPSAGYRKISDGNYSIGSTEENGGIYGIYWTNSIDGNKSSRHNFFNDMAVTFFGEGRAHGFSVRCIKD